MENDVKILREGNHYVAYVNGKIYCSADTHREAVQELIRDGIL